MEHELDHDDDLGSSTSYFTDLRDHLEPVRASRQLSGDASHQPSDQPSRKPSTPNQSRLRSVVNWLIFTINWVYMRYESSKDSDMKRSISIGSAMWFGATFFMYKGYKSKHNTITWAIECILTVVCVVVCMFWGKRAAKSFAKYSVMIVSHFMVFAIVWVFLCAVGAMTRQAITDWCMVTGTSYPLAKYGPCIEFEWIKFLFSAASAGLTGRLSPYASAITRDGTSCAAAVSTLEFYSKIDKLYMVHDVDDDKKIMLMEMRECKTRLADAESSWVSKVLSVFGFNQTPNMDALDFVKRNTEAMLEAYVTATQHMAEQQQLQMPEAEFYKGFVVTSYEKAMELHGYNYNDTDRSTKIEMLYVQKTLHSAISKIYDTLRSNREMFLGLAQEKDMSETWWTTKQVVSENIFMVGALMLMSRYMRPAAAPAPAVVAVA